MDRKKILLIKPSSERRNASIAPPIGLLYLASYVRYKFHDYYNIKLLDMRIDKHNDSQLRLLVEDYKPDIVGISVCSEDDSQLHKIAKIVKDCNKNIHFIAGGPHPTICWDDIIKDKNIDIAVVGEGEITFYEILENIKEGRIYSNIPGVAYKMNGKTYVNTQRDYIKDLDELPFPSWDLLKIEKYSELKVNNMNDILGGYKYMGIVTSRGCPYSCIYCHGIFGKKFRKRSAENVFLEMKYLVRNYGIDEFHIYDDIFNLDTERVNNICDMIINERLNVRLAFPNGIRGDIIEKQLLSKLKDAGAYMVTFAVESASDRIQKLIKKNIRKKILLDNIDYSNKLGLLTKCYFMIGFPTETMSEIRHTIDFACKAPLDFAAFFIVTPQKETQLFHMINKKNPDFRMGFDSMNQYFSKNKVYERLLGKPLKKIQLYAYWKFYFNFKRILNIYMKMPRKIFMASGIKKILNLFLTNK